MVDPREIAENDRLNAELVMGNVLGRYKANDPKALRDYMGSKLAPVGWANAQQRADARSAYALEGKTPEEMQERWDNSRLLVDPSTQQSQEKFLRDYRLLDGLLRKDDPGKVVDEFVAPLDTRLAPEMVNANSQLSRPDQIIDMPFWSSAGPALLQNLQDPESGAGWYMGRANLGPNMGKYAGGGEAKNFSDAIGMAAGDLGFKEMHRMGSRVPVADLPNDASQSDIRSRVGELRGQAGLIDAPQYKERWMRTAGYDPGPVAGFLSDLGYDFLDPSLVVDVAAGPTKALLSPTARAYMAAQGGLLKNLTRELGSELVGEGAVEVPFAVGVNAIAGGGGQAYGDHDVKTPEELAEAQRLRNEYELKHFGWNDPSNAAYNQVVLPEMKRRRDELHPYGTDAFGNPIVPTPGPFAPLPQGVASNR